MRITREPIYADEPRGVLDAVRRHVVSYLARVGRCVRLAAEAMAYAPYVLAHRDSRRTMIAQLYVTGIRTLPVITVVGVFTGMIMGLQVGLALRRFSQEAYLGATVMLTLVREMGPFVTGICLSACVGSAMAAELGTMTVNDEVAALEIMHIPPVRYLVAPRLAALVAMSPLLAFYACVLGVMGGGLVGYTQLNVDFSQYMASAMSMATVKDVYVGLFKATVFGLVIGAVSCHEGFKSTLGAVGVGRATQRSVIVSFLLILTLGYVITRLFYLDFLP